MPRHPLITPEQREARRRAASSVDGQQGFSTAAAELLAKPWIAPEVEEDYNAFTLAEFMEND